MRSPHAGSHQLGAVRAGVAAAAEHAPVDHDGGYRVDSVLGGPRHGRVVAAQVVDDDLLVVAGQLTDAGHLGHTDGTTGAEDFDSSRHHPTVQDLERLVARPEFYALGSMQQFPSMRWPELRRVLEREPLSYAVVSQRGSHRKMESSNGYPPLKLAFHDGATLPPGLVRSILVKTIGLPAEAALALL